MAFSSAPRLYFAYGSSLALSEMKSRCPTSTFYSIALLRNHRWFVNERGYANVLPSGPGSDGAEDVVWGILYTLRPFDEELLDKQEGIPWAYSKVDMDVEAIGITEDGRGTRREVVRALVYIDRERTQESYPWPEFMLKMNKGIQEAVERGLPTPWADRVVRPYMLDPSTVNGGERQAQVEGAASPDKGVRQTPVTRPESDRDSQIHGSEAGGQTMNGEPQSPRSNHASQTHGPEDIIIGGHFVNGGSQKGRSNNNTNNGGPSSGLEKSKYAYESRPSGAQERKAARAQQQGSSGLGKAAPSPNQIQNTKQLECWWWKVRGSCRFSDTTCQYAHHDTGVVADPPGAAKKGSSHEKRNNASSFQPKNIPRRERSPSFKSHHAGKENQKHPYGYQQDWSAGNQQDWNMAPSQQQQQQQEPEGKIEANASWSEQVENLMDSEPEWLVANDRKDVKW